MRVRGVIIAVAALAAVFATCPVVQAQTSEYFVVSGDQQTFYVLQGGVLLRSWNVAPGTHNYQYPIAVIDTIRTMGANEGDVGAEYDLNGADLGARYTHPVGPDRSWDGTTDGDYNYAIDIDGDIYSYDRDWSNPVFLFDVGDLGGLTYDPANDSLWVCEWGSSQITNYTMSGTVLSSFNVGHTLNMALALDHADDTLWLHDRNAMGTFEQWSKTGTLLTRIAVPGMAGQNALGGEFALPTADLLYDVDFGTPPHLVGKPPMVGTGPAPRETPTAIVFGEPLVVAALSALRDQPCAFGYHPTDPYDQLEFYTRGGSPQGFPRAYDLYHIEMDLVFEEVALGSYAFTVLLDTPTVRNIYFYSDGRIRAWPCPGQDIGTFQFGIPLFLELDLDVVNDELTISVDGQALWSGECQADELRSIRMSMDMSDDLPDPMAVDNFRVSGVAGPCPGDVDGDGDTDLADLAELLAAYGSVAGDPNYNPNADFDNDGDVDLGDLAHLLADYGCGT